MKVSFASDRMTFFPVAKKKECSLSHRTMCPLDQEQPADYNHRAANGEAPYGFDGCLASGELCPR